MRKLIGPIVQTGGRIQGLCLRGKSVRSRTLSRAPAPFSKRSAEWALPRCH